ncbi:EamA family transporter [Nosocomiicoccus massiliensis]|uniref:EamA family transporter n=1 Tax=Nosocomiicoccus massiliensis TaxID=1232430 RepID=A0AAF0YNS5_9STAP|nr:EamA family transporter [Nosocomiicoccus massiliensis]WOS96587.1 EamA family transporter [Nosocomiicoccus massiliensis]
MTERHGILTAILAYTLWGLTPLYWALLEDIHPIEVVLVRTIMSFLFMILIIPIFNHTGRFYNQPSHLK